MLVQEMRAKFKPNELNILIVEDNLFKYDQIRYAMERYGIKYTHVTNERDAIVKILYENYEVVILDMHFPKMVDGSILPYTGVNFIRLLMEYNNVGSITMPKIIGCSNEDFFMAYRMRYKEQIPDSFIGQVEKPIELNAFFEK